MCSNCAMMTEHEGHDRHLLEDIRKEQGEILKQLIADSKSEHEAWEKRTRCSDLHLEKEMVRIEEKRIETRKKNETLGIIHNCIISNLFDVIFHQHYARMYLHYLKYITN